MGKPTKPTKPGITLPRNQVAQSNSIPYTSNAVLEIMGFAAIPVKNMAAVIRFAWAPTRWRYSPANPGFFWGSEPSDLDIESTIGAMIPPPLAVFDGTSGPRINSEAQIAYPNPITVFPSTAMQIKAILFPKPVSMITPAIRNAMTTSHVVESPKPISASFKDIKLVITDSSNPVSTLVDMGIAFIKIDSMVEVNTMNII